MLLVDHDRMVQTYMDPASAQGCLLVLRIGCSNLSGLLLGDTLAPLALMESAHFQPHHSCDLVSLASTQVWKVPV